MVGNEEMRGCGMEDKKYMEVLKILKVLKKHNEETHKLVEQYIEEICKILNITYFPFKSADNFKIPKKVK